MSHLFCSSCGTKNLFINGKRPNFCYSCASPLANFNISNATNQSVVQRPNVRNAPQHQNIIEEESFIEGGFSRNDVQIEVDNSTRIKGRDLLNGAGGIGSARQPLNTSVAESTFSAEDFKREAGVLTRNTSTEVS